MSDRKRMKKQHDKKIIGLKRQIEIHEEKLRTKKGRKDTTQRYWEEEVEEFKEGIEKSEKYLEEH